MYTSKYESSSAKRASVALRMHSKSDSIARTITPAPPAVEPTIVCVFPEPVAPYASTVALRPLTTSSISGRVVTRKTASWPASASKTWSYAYLRLRATRTPIRRPSAAVAAPPFDGGSKQIILSSTTLTIERPSPRRSPSENGRTRTATKMASEADAPAVEAMARSFFVLYSYSIRRSTPLRLRSAG